MHCHLHKVITLNHGIIASDGLEKHPHVKGIFVKKKDKVLKILQ